MYNNNKIIKKNAYLFGILAYFINNTIQYNTIISPYIHFPFQRFFATFFRSVVACIRISVRYIQDRANGIHNTPKHIQKSSIGTSLGVNHIRLASIGVQKSVKHVRIESIGIQKKSRCIQKSSIRTSVAVNHIRLASIGIPKKVNHISTASIGIWLVFFRVPIVVDILNCVSIPMTSLPISMLCYPSYFYIVINQNPVFSNL